MNNEICDGNIHPLDKNFAYIFQPLPFNGEENENLIELSKKQKEFAKKYADYLIRTDKEKVIKILMDYIIPDCFGRSNDFNHQFIFRPPWMTSYLAQKAHLVLKFKRSERDNLDEGDH